MRCASLAQIAALHTTVVGETRGAARIRDHGALDSAVAQPRMTFGGVDLYPSLAEKAAAIGYSLDGTIRSLTATSESGTPPWKHS